MTGYGQICALALALDRIGDRWSLLIVRELLIGPHRFSELRRALAGMAPNLLSSRLQTMQDEGLVEKQNVLRNVEAYALTERGRALEEAVGALIRWGGQFVPDAPPEGHERPEWLLVALPAILHPAADPAVSLTCNLTVDGLALSVQWSEGRIAVREGHFESPDVEIEASYRLVLGGFSGMLPLQALASSGARIKGQAERIRQLERLVPSERR